MVIYRIALKRLSHSRISVSRVSGVSNDVTNLAYLLELGSSPVIKQAS